VGFIEIGGTNNVDNPGGRYRPGCCHYKKNIIQFDEISGFVFVIGFEYLAKQRNTANELHRHRRKEPLF
jgi:hypothetical protein